MTTRGLQYIIDNASAIEVARPKTVAQMMTRSGRVKTAERTALVPYILTITPPSYSKFEDVRDVIEGITLTDRNNSAWVQLSANSGLNYITDYRGDLTNTQLNAIRSNTGTTATVFSNGDFDTSIALGYTTSTNFDYVQIANLPNLGAVDKNGNTITTSSYVFRAGDYIQLKTVNSGATSWALVRTIPVDVLRGSGSTVNVPVHRRWNNISNLNRLNSQFFFGNDVRLKVLISKMPTFKLLPGQIVQWSGDFELIENIT